MDKTHRLVLTLLIISLIMSAVSIAINVAILKLDIGAPRNIVQSNSQLSSSGTGNIGLFVEGASGGANG